MKTPTVRQLQRIEKKRKKMAALLEITKLNDKDREAKALALKQAVEELKMNVSSDQCGSNSDSSSKSPSRKRPCIRTIEDNALEKIDSKPLTTENEGSEEQDSVTNKKPRLSGEEYLKLKQELRERKQRLMSIPRFRLKNVGENASINNIKGDDRIPIFLSDVQHLLMYSLLGHHSPYLPARWCSLEKYNKVSHTSVLVVEGLSLFHFMAYESMFSNITTHMSNRLEVVTPAAYGGSVVEELAAVPLTGTQSQRLIRKFGSLEAALQSTGDLVKLLRTVFPMHPAQTPADEKSSSVVKTSSPETHEELPVTDKFPRTQLLLSPWQLVEENYPLPLKGELAKKYKEYILTKDTYLEATPRSPMFGLDCEMCRTTTGLLELTRISVVDERMNIIYETLVKPDNRITDYLTRYSGITRELLEGVTTTLSDVQQALIKILPPDAILIGHSLNSDLHTLKMMHPYIIDTSVIYNITGDRYRKTKLQTLAREFLDERIQEGRRGHCPAEDSRASLKLAQLKLANSVDFGDSVLTGQRDMEILKMGAEKRKSLKTVDKSELRNYATSIFNHVTKDKKSAAIIGTEEVMNEYSRYLKNSSLSIMDDMNFEASDQVRLVVAENNKNAVKRASNVLMEHAFTLCHVRISEEQLMDENIEKTFKAVNKWVRKLWQHTALHGLGCVVFSGQNNAANGACFLDLKTDITVLTP